MIKVEGVRSNVRKALQLADNKLMVTMFRKTKDRDFDGRFHYKLNDVIISERDADLLEKHYFRVKEWYCKDAFGSKKVASIYVYGGNNKGEYSNQFLHRIILSRIVGRKLKKHELCDHIDGNTLNNSRSNLRLADFGQSSLNRVQKSKLGITGVCRYEYSFRAYVKIGSVKLQKKFSFSKYGKNAKAEAIKWREEMEKKYHGEFSVRKSRGL